VKVHIGTRGNELADTLEKKAATNGTITEYYIRIPKWAVLRQPEEVSVQM